MKLLAIAPLVTLLLIGGCDRPQPARSFSQQALDKALADPARKDQRDAADAVRKPGH
jgi:hypothetical protein